jgi:hypothetical protein
VDVDLVVACAVVAAKDERLRQSVDEFFVPDSGDGYAREGHVGGNNAVERARGAFLEEVCAVGRFGCDELCDGGKIFQIRMGAAMPLELGS